MLIFWIKYNNYINFLKKINYLNLVSLIFIRKNLLNLIKKILLNLDEQIFLNEKLRNFFLTLNFRNNKTKIVSK